MANNQGTSTAGIDQVSTVDVGPTPTPPLDAQGVPSVRPGQPSGPQGGPISATRAPNQGPQPNAGSPQGDPTDPTAGVGTEGELEVWEGRYSMRNFVGRVITLSVLSVLWVVMAIYAWGYDYSGLTIPSVIAGVVLLLLWAGLLSRMIRAHFGYKYRLTTRRLFVSTGIFHRETNQLELLRVQDVYNRQQNVMERLLNVGSVIIVSDEKTMPNYVLLGVSDPKGVMDLVWHHARAEQDQRNVRVEQI
jgi:membrane protein YdbS with pleckstrin-like domain